MDKYLAAAVRHGKDQDRHGIRLENSDFLKCRGLCRSWKSSMDSFLQKHPPPLALDDKSTAWSYGPYGWDCKQSTASTFGSVTLIWNTWKTSEGEAEWNKALKKTQEIIASRVQPFPNGHLCLKFKIHSASVSIDVPDKFAQFVRLTTKMLEKFGRHLLHLDLEIRLVYEEELTEFYKLLCGWLKLMPNLKALGIYLSIVYLKWEGDHKNNVARLESVLVDFPCPTLKNLELLKFNQVPYEIVRSILGANEQVDKLYLRFPYGNNNVDGISLKNVKEYYHEPARIRNVQASFGDGDGDCSLEKLNLRFDDDDRDVQLDEGFFKVLNSFGNTLTHLRLNTVKVSRECPGRLRLPELKELQVGFEESLLSVDFILDLHSLESLTLNLFVDDEYEGAEGAIYDDFLLGVEIGGENNVIQFAKDGVGNVDMLASNVWQLLPKLREITLDIFGDYKPPMVFSKNDVKSE